MGLLASRSEEKNFLSWVVQSRNWKPIAVRCQRQKRKQKKGRQVLTARSFLSFIAGHLRALRLLSGSPNSPLHIIFHFSPPFHSMTGSIFLTPSNFSQGHTFQRLPTHPQTATKECESDTSKHPFLHCFGKRIKMLRKLCDFYMIISFSIFKPR